jgi:hypothetical protein
MFNFKGFSLIFFSASLLMFPLCYLLLSVQSAKSQDEQTGSTSSPLEIYTEVQYCNGTPQLLSAAIGFKPNFTPWNWRNLTPGSCRVITWKRYSGRVDFFSALSAYNLQAFSQSVVPGKQCYRYIQNGNLLELRRESCH